MHLVPESPGTRLVSLGHRAVPMLPAELPPWLSLRATDPVAQESVGLTVLAENAAYEAFLTSTPLRISATGTAAQSGDRRDRAFGLLCRAACICLTTLPETLPGWASTAGAGPC